MGKDTTQPTPIDKQEYEAFKNFVRDVHGRTRGHLGTEIENALREYRKSASGSDRLQRIEDDIATIKATVAQAESDGGTVTSTPSDDSNTRTRGSAKPAANQPRTQKVGYLIDKYYDRTNCNSDGGVIVEKEIRQVVKSEYSFDTDIVDEYVADIAEELNQRHDTEPHPSHGAFDVWGSELEAAKEEAEKKANEDLGEVAD